MSLIRLLRYRRAPRQNRPVSRRGIILRDGNACQYFGRALAGKDFAALRDAGRLCIDDNKEIWAELRCGKRSRQGLPEMS